MSQQDDILFSLADHHGTYKNLWNQMTGRMDAPELEERRRKRELKETTLRATLCRLKRQGLVERRGIIWYLTTKGRNVVNVLKRETTKRAFPSHSEPKTSAQFKSVIIVFDIPEAQRWKRDWLRDELEILGFEPIQKSVWFGPKPPKEFIQYLSDLNLLPHIKFFKAKSAEIV